MGRAYEVRKASIQKTGAARGKIYTMYAKEIYQAAKNGGTEVTSNATLKRLLDRAKKEQVPNDIIKRAIDKVNSGADESYTSVRYEGFASGGATVMVDCLTDNVNRTVSLVRNAFTKSKAKMGVSGCACHMYEHLSVVVVKDMTEDEAIEALLMGEVDVKEIEAEDGNVSIYGDPSDLYKIKDAILNARKDVEFIVDEVTYLPNETVLLEGEDKENFDKLISMLDDIEDVQKVYHNVVI